MEGHNIVALPPSTTLLTPSVSDVIDAGNIRYALRKMNDDMNQAVFPITVFVGIEAGVGFLGNAVVLYIFLLRYKPCNFRYFVLCLAFIDILSTLTTIPSEIVTQLNWYIYPNKELCKAKSFFNVFTVSGEALGLLTIAVDRYRKVCHPHRWQIRPIHAKRLCLAILCVAFIFALPVAFLWGIRSHEHGYNYRGTSVTVKTTICEKDEHFENTGWPFIYSITVQVMCSLCLVAMFGLYVLVARRVFKNTMLKRRKLTTQTSLQYVTSDGSSTTSKPGELETSSAKETPTDARQNSKLGTPYKHTGESETESKYVRSFADSEQDGDSENNRKETGTVDGEGVMTNVQINATHITRDTAIADAEASSSTSSQSLSVRRTASRRTPHVKKDPNSRLRRRTLIMFILTLIFIITTTTYLTLLSLVALTDDILQSMSDSGKACYFFFLRLVFINHVINPVVYGILDPQFRNIVKELERRLTCKLPSFRINMCDRVQRSFQDLIPCL